MSNSPEYNCILDCTPELRRSAELNLLSLCAELLAARLINEDKEKSLRNRNVCEVDRAAELESLVAIKVQEDPANYHLFVDILKKDEQQYKTLITLLEETYKSRKETTCVPAPAESVPKLKQLHYSNGHNKGQPNGELVKSKSVVDSASQTLSLHTAGGASNQHQAHPAFGGICGCGICGSDLGCPNPLPAETTFPLLEHVNGLNKVQKDDLRARLKTETKQIMMQFYTLLSKFFNSLKERKVNVDDIKTHLMVLDAFDDDDNDPAFHEQRDKLDQAVTINDIFKVIKVFCSFFNYDLIEHLIDIIGTDEDKARLEEYKTKFTEYARRRIYECPPKMASMSTAGQCDNCMYIKLESRYSEKLSLNDLRDFRFNISKLLKVSHHVIRLCCIEKGCIRLTFQIPQFVKQRLFPLTSEQGNSLLQLGATKLICGDYEFPIEEKPEIPPTNGPYQDKHSRTSAQSCLDCDSKTGEIILFCKEHYVCNECSANRKSTMVHRKDTLKCSICNSATTMSQTAHLDSSYTYRDALLHEQHTTPCTRLTNSCTDVQQQPSTVPATSARGIWIFVNDSNIWIEAKKLQSKQKMFKMSEDHRVRMDMGKLADVLAKKRPIIEGSLYGSEPPSIDTVWKQIHEQGWKVHTTQRTSRGKEKQVSTTFIVDVVALAEKTPPEQRSSIILVTGDASVIPAIEKIVEIEGWNVEVYMWSHATSKQLHKLQLKHGTRVTVSSLDPYLNDITFTNMKFNYMNKNFLKMVKNCSIVFTVNVNPRSFPGYVPTDQWMRRLEEIAERPCQYYWYHHPEIGRTSKLVIVFKRDSKDTFDVSTFLKKVISSDKIQIPSVVRVQTFIDFESSDRLDQLGGDFEQLGIFSRNDVQDGFRSDSVYVTSTSSKGPESQTLSKWSPHVITA